MLQMIVLWNFHTILSTILSGQNHRQNGLNECVFVNSALKNFQSLSIDKVFTF